MSPSQPAASRRRTAAEVCGSPPHHVGCAATAPKRSAKPPGPDASTGRYGENRVCAPDGYVLAAGLPPLLVQGAAFELPNVGTGALQTLSEPGTGYDVDFGEAAVGNNSDKNKGGNASWCLLSYTKGGYNGFPPVNSGGVDAIRLEGVVTDAVDPANLGVPVKLYVASGATIDPHHSVCLVKFFFGPFGPWTGRGLAIVNQ